jgi:hypothetical protein
MPDSTISTEKVVTVTLQPNTIATIFGVIRDASVNEQVALVELFAKGVRVEKTVTLDGKKDRPYHVVGEQGKFAVTWGPFSEQKTIQVALYRTDASGNSIEPIGTLKELVDNISHTKVTLISVYHQDRNRQTKLMTVVNITRMLVK